MMHHDQIGLLATNLHENAHAVIDIGSNSVRMVVYHGIVRVPMPLFNEKYYCGLGQGLAQTGKLNPKGCKLAMQAIARFVVMAKRLKVADLTVMATAAVRDASDGENFVATLEKKFGIHVDILSGDQEAQLAALGVLASFHDPLGITVDLGGGSMELAYIEQDHIAHQCSLELGAIRLLDESGGDIKTMQSMVRNMLSDVSWIEQQTSDIVYAVGGSFRTIAKMHMRKVNYPLPILHEYSISASSIDRISFQFRHLSIDEIAALPGITKNRAQTLLPAIVILQHLMRRSKAHHVIFSVSGIREGLLFHQLKAEQQQRDPLIASARDLASLAGRKGRYAQELFEWMQPLFPLESPQKARLRMALCILSELAWTIDPNFRGEWAYLRVIQSAIKGVTHPERVMLGLALYHRYQQKWKQPRPEISMLDETDMAWARCVGMAANLAFHLSGGKGGNLYHARLGVEGKSVRLELDNEAKPLRTDTVEKRLEGLGSAFKALSSLAI